MKMKFSSFYRKDASGKCFLFQGFNFLDQQQQQQQHGLYRLSKTKDKLKYQSERTNKRIKFHFKFKLIPRLPLLLITSSPFVSLHIILMNISEA